MAITNVGELKAAVADWINREDIADAIPGFIAQADNRILSDSRSAIIPLDEEVVKTVQPNAQLSPYVFDGGVPLSILVDDKIVEPASWETYWQSRTDSSIGKVWTYYEGKIWYTGWPDRDEGADLSADPVGLRVKTRSKPELDMSDDANTSLMLESHPELYLFATLTEAATYLRDVEGIQLYQVRYEGLFSEIAKGYKRRKVANGFTVSSVGGDFNFDRSY